MTSSITASLGIFFLDKFHFLGGTCLLVIATIREFFKPPYYPRLIIDQIYHIGSRSLTLIIVATISTGMVMSLQFGVGLEKFGAKLYVPYLVGLSIVKEMGPVFTSLIFASRVGSGIASELSSMMITQQVDAIKALGTSPIKRLVIPRVVACFISLPLLTIIANTFSMIGAITIGMIDLGLDPQLFMRKVSDAVNLYDFLSGFLKTFVFALLVAFTSCYYGLNVKSGTKGVGIATTKAVVMSSLLILIGDFFLSKIFWEIELWLSLK